MAWYIAPTHRNVNDEQPEVCQLCGCLVGHAHLRVGDVEGMRGFRICDLHRFERVAMGNPSWNDYRRLTPPARAPFAGAPQPLFGQRPLWFHDETQDE